MNYTMQGLLPTTVTDGLGGNSFNSAHLSRAYGIDKPHDLSMNDIGLTQIFSATDRYHAKPLLGMTEGKGKKMLLTSNQYTWKLTGHKKESLRIIEVIETSIKPGLGGNTFDVVLDKSWFKYPDVLIGETSVYPLEVVGQPTPYAGGGYRYTLRLQDDQAGLFFPVQYIQVGQKFMKVSTSVADELNQDYGTMQFNSIFEVRNQTGNAAMGLNVTDKMLRIDKNSTDKAQAKHWRVPYFDNEGKPYLNFMPLLEAEMWNELYDNVEWALTFGRKSTRVGPQGYLKRTAPGLRQQLEYSNQLYHNGNLTLARLDEWLSSIYRGRKDADPSARKIVLSTGEMGARMFHEMVATQASTFLTLDTYFIDGKDPRHLSFGAQFTHYRGKNGLDVTVMLDPNKDNPEYCPQMHPQYPDTPIDSWRMDILDFGSTKEQTTGEMGDNISYVAEKFADVYFCTAGKWDKNGFPINDGSMGIAGGVGGYSVSVEKSFGLMIRDITRCGVISLRFDQ